MEGLSPSFGRGQRNRVQPSKLTYSKLGSPMETSNNQLPNTSRNPQPVVGLVPVPKPRRSLMNASVVELDVKKNVESKQNRVDETLAKFMQEMIDKQTEREVSNARTLAVNRKLDLFKSIPRQLTDEEQNEVFKLECEAIDLNALLVGIEAQERSIQEKIKIQQQLLEKLTTEDDNPSSSSVEMCDMGNTRDWITHQNVMKFGAGANATENEFSPPETHIQRQPNNEQGMMMNLMQRQLELMSRPSGDATRGDKDLPAFGGRPEDWSAFIGEFDRTTQQYRIQNSENLRRLRKSLKGVAIETVRSLMANPDNVPEIMRTLKVHYGRPEHIIRSLIKKARETKSPEVNKPETWITYAIAVQSLVVNIQTYSTDGKYLNDTFLLDELIDKLPVSMQKEWIIWRSTYHPTTCSLQVFCEWMNIQRETACAIAKLEVIDEDSDGKRTRRRGAGVHVMTEENPQCQFCEKTGHVIDKCFQFKKKPTDERWNIVKEKRLCFLCLCVGHNTTKCANREKCGLNSCDKKHHSLLHRSPSTKKSEVTPTNDKKDVPEETASHKMIDDPPLGSLNAAHQKDSLPIIPVLIKGPNGTKQIYALLDSGASCSIIEESVVNDLGIHGVQRPFRFTVFGKGVREHKSSMKINAYVAGAYTNARFYEVTDIRTIPQLGISGCSVNVDKLKNKYPHFQRLRMQSYDGAVPQMIIGFDNNRLSAAREILENTDDKEMPTAYKCLLGWYVCSGRSGRNCFHVNEITEMNELMHDDMKRFFSSENFGIKYVADWNRSLEDKRALQLLEENTKRIGDRWQTSLLWKQDDPYLPESYSMALKRLQSMERKMDRDPVFAKLVMDKFENYLEKGFLKKRETFVSTGDNFEDRSRASASNSDACGLRLVKDLNEEKKRWYLPWFFAYHPTKKPRLVFDAAARSHNKSLNDFLLKGPDLLQPLVYVLIRFRRHLIAVTGDIAEMFHQVRLSPCDKKSQTVLYRGLDRTMTPSEYEIEVLFFGSACSPASAIYAKNKNAREYIETNPAAVTAIILDHYMDDYCGGCSSVTDAITLRKEISAIHQHGGFKMCKWNSNSTEVLHTIPSDVRAEGNMTISDDVNCDKLLGMLWNPVKDVFMFNLNFRRVPVNVMNGERLPTKRELASVIMSLFDPLGFLCPLKVKALVMLQETWKSGVGWDQIVDSIDEKWKEWLTHLRAVEDICIPRLYFTGDLSTCDVEMHTFVDASQEASACAVYLLFKTGGSVDKVVFVAGKVRVAPIRGLTIPRMELQGAVMGSRLSTTVVKAFNDELKITRRLYWTDSKTVLFWLRSTTGKYNQFVSARIGEIQETTEVNSWRWVPTKLNVADDATRSNEKNVMTSDSRWLIGPAFLYLEEDKWPVERDLCEYQVSNCELKTESTVAVCVEETSSLPEVQRFSSWIRLIRSTAMMFVCMRRFRKQLPYQITIKDLERAETTWIRKSQEDSFPEDLLRLKCGKTVPKQSKIYKLSPKLNQNGIIVLSGRIQKADVSDSVKTPPILDSKHDYTKLYIEWQHVKSHHFGQERVLNELRQQVWILNARAAVRKCWANCNVCIFRRSIPVPPEMGQIPSARLETGNPPFNSTGVDYFGPYLVTVKRSTEKRWGVLFTCLATRAVHLEIAESLDTSDMLNALVRFVNMRGTPHHIWSDNGTNFVGAKREIEESFFSWKDKQIEDFVSVKMIQWHFIPPASPHMGGSWERMVGSTKRILNVILKEQHPREGTLRTLFTEVMNILNSRPLTHVPDSPDDLECLTPNHLLKMSCVVGPTIVGEYNRDDKYKKSWRYGQYLAEQFWTRFKKEYVPTLARRGKWFERVKQIKVGDLVLVVDDQVTRNLWKRGIITNVFPSKSGQTRIAEVKVSCVDPKDPLKTVKSAILQRSVMKLCLLSFQRFGGTTPGRENVAEDCM